MRFERLVASGAELGYPLDRDFIAFSYQEGENVQVNRLGVGHFRPHPGEVFPNRQSGGVPIQGKRTFHRRGLVRNASLGGNADSPQAMQQEPGRRFFRSG